MKKGGKWCARTAAAPKMSVAQFVKKCWVIDNAMKRAEREHAGGPMKAKKENRVRELKLKFGESYLACGYS